MVQYIEKTEAVFNFSWSICLRLTFLRGGGRHMFQFGEKVIDKSGRIYSITGVEDKDFGTGKEPYFILTPFFDYGLNPGFQSFIPVSRSESLLKKILSKEEALSLIDTLTNLQPFPEASPRERKLQYTKIVASGNRNDILRVIKSLLDYREQRKKANKPFSDFDKRLLDSLRTMFENEMSLALEIAPSEVEPFIRERIGMAL